jgi:AraC-like DNA-binding protein
MLGLQISGSSLVVQDGREATVRPGDLVLYRSTAPYTIIDGDGYRQHQLRIPQHELAIPSEVLQMVTATRLSPGHPVSDLASAYFQRLISQQRALSEARAQIVSQPSLELIRAVISTHLDTDSLKTRESHHATLLLRVLEYTRTHLGEPTLNAAQIATEHHVSVRHLYNVLAAGGISLGDWIRQQRLEACRTELNRPHAQDVTIASVAQRWGFRDASNFGRAFRAEYGLSPSEWRASPSAITNPHPLT